MHPKPLTRRNSLGEIYVRTPEVESQIKYAMGLDPPSLIERACNSDHKSLGFLKEECLVYLIREYLARDDKRTTEQLFKILFERCAEFIYQRLYSLERDRAEDLYQDICSQLIDKIMDLESDRGDFLQVRFWVVLKKLALTAYSNLHREYAREESHFQSLYLQTDEGEVMIDIPDSSISQDEVAACKEGINALKGRHREVFVLRHFGGWPISSNDPEDETLSARFGVSPRTIQNWIEEAEKTLLKWKEGRRK